MKIIKRSLFVGFIFMIACTSDNHKNNSAVSLLLKTIDSTIIVHKDSLVLNGNEGNWYYNKQLFNGYAVQYHTNNILKNKTGFFNGKKQGVYKLWFKNGVLKLQSNYNQNKLEGSYKSWWSNGKLATKSNYKNGRLQGISCKWYSNGTLSKERNLDYGKENGTQKAWLENGKLYVNYEVKNGRIFGMRRANSCYLLEDETLVEK